MKRALAIMAVTSLLSTSHAMDRLSALSMLETGNNDHKIGHRGEVSRYQILPHLFKKLSQHSGRHAYCDSLLTPPKQPI